MGTAEMTIFSFALNLDIFVVSFYVGTLISRMKVIPVMSVIIAFFQSLIPLTGYLIGNLLGGAFGNTSSQIGALVLVLVGIQLIKESFHLAPPLTEQNLLLIYLGVGLEDLMAGVSFGTLSNKVFLFMVLFFLIACCVNFIALSLGKALKRFLNVPAGFITGTILLIMGTVNFCKSIENTTWLKIWSFIKGWPF